MSNDKRMIGDYEIIHALQIGNQESTDGQKYMCAFCEQNFLFTRCDEMLCSNDYPEIIGKHDENG